MRQCRLSTSTSAPDPAIGAHLAISVSFLIRTSGKDSHSQAGSTKHIHISSRSLQLEEFYIRSVPHPCNWSSSTEFISTFSTSARLTWVQVRRQCTFRNFCKLAESGYHICFIIWNKSLASLHNDCNYIDCTYNCLQSFKRLSIVYKRNVFFLLHGRELKAVKEVLAHLQTIKRS